MKNNIFEDVINISLDHSILFTMEQQKLSEIFNKINKNSENFTFENILNLLRLGSVTLFLIIFDCSIVSEKFLEFGLEFQFINESHVIKLNNKEISFEFFFQHFTNNDVLENFFLDLKILAPKIVFDTLNDNIIYCIKVLETYFFWELRIFPINAVTTIQNYFLQKYKKSQDSVHVFKNLVKKIKSIDNIRIIKIFDFINISSFLYCYQEQLFKDSQVIDVLKYIKKEIKDNEFFVTVNILKNFLYKTIENRVFDWKDLSFSANSVTNKYFHDMNLEYLTLVIVFGDEIENDFDFSEYSNIKKCGKKRIGLINEIQLYGIINYSIILSNFSLLKKIIFYNLILVKNKKNIRILILRNWKKLTNSGFFTNRELYAIVNNCSEAEYESDSGSDSDSDSDSDLNFIDMSSDSDFDDSDSDDSDTD